MTLQDTTPPPPPSAPAGGPTSPSSRPVGGEARSLLRGLGIALSVLAVAAGTVSLVGSLARESLQRNASYQGIRVVDVEVSAEEVEVVAGSDDVTRLSRRISWSLGRPTVTEQQDGDRLVVRSSCPWSMGRGCSGSVRLVVPPSVQVHAHSSAGAVRAQGLTGRLDLSSSAGSVEGEGLGAAQVAADSSAGSVHLQFAAAPTGVDATSSAGSVEVVVPRGTEGYRVDASSSAGSTDVGVRTDPTSTRRIHAESSAGSVEVSYGG